MPFMQVQSPMALKIVVSKYVLTLNQDLHYHTYTSTHVCMR